MKRTRQPGFFDIAERTAKLIQMRDPLVGLNERITPRSRQAKRQPNGNNPHRNSGCAKKTLMRAGPRRTTKSITASRTTSMQTKLTSWCIAMKSAMLRHTTVRCLNATGPDRRRRGKEASLADASITSKLSPYSLAAPCGRRLRRCAPRPRSSAQTWLARSVAPAWCDWRSAFQAP